MGDFEGFQYLSTGDLLRRLGREGTKVGRQALSVVAEGKLVPDEVVTKIVLGEIAERSPGRLLLDGFPRTLRQAALLEEHIKVQNE